MRFLILLLFIPSLLLADGEANSLLDALKAGEDTVARERLVEVLLKGEKTEKPQESATKDDGRSTPRSELLKDLVREVDRLKQEVDVTKYVSLATQKPARRKKIGAKTVFNHQEGAIFEIYTSVDSVTDLVLQPGEKLTNVPVAGDTVRWKISAITSGAGEKEQTHLIIKPLEEDIETNFVITTDRHVYHIKALSTSWYMPAVSFNYPDEEKSSFNALRKRKEASRITGIDPATLNFNYRVEESDFKWRPVRVFDDGIKTYIQMPSSVSAYEAPAFFILSGSDPELTNYRVKGAYYIIDRLFTHGVLRVGPEEGIEVYGSNYKESFFERIF